MGYQNKNSASFPGPTRVSIATSDSDNEDNSSRYHQNAPDQYHKHALGKADSQRRDRADALSLSRRQLPVFEGKDAILQEVKQNETLIVLGETGCGKTTQIPQYLIEADFLKFTPDSAPIKVVVTQPRRVAAISLASRVSEEVGCQLGTRIGYTVRFDDCSDKKTRLKFVTDGTLLQELLSDHLLSNYDIVVLDEAHERSLRTDMLMGFLKGIQRTRREMVAADLRFPRDKEVLQSGLPARPLKIIVMSATIEAQRFSEFFDDAKIIYIEGRQYPVTPYYVIQPLDDYVQSAVQTCLQIHAYQPPGDVLVFFTGQDDIENAQAELAIYAKDIPLNMTKMLICPLYARLPPEQQKKVFQKTPPHFRKFILATNVAETSITIPGVNYVVDTGFAKVKRFHSLVGVEELSVEPISQSSANQRSGRAGREGPGKCWRLYTEQVLNNLPKTIEPEIQRCSLSFAILHLLATGVQDIFSFDFMDKPKSDDLKFALIHLAILGALGSDGKISALGRKMAKLPLDPPLARCLLASLENRCAPDMIDLIALLEYSDSLLINSINTRDQAQEARRRFLHRDGDHLILLNILKAWQSLADSPHACRKSNSGTPKVELKDWCKEHFINFKAMNNVLESRKQLRDRCNRLGLHWNEVSDGESAWKKNSTISETDSAPILCSLMAGLGTQLAFKNPDQSYVNPLTKTPVKIHPSSSLYGKGVESFIYQELVHTTSTYARMCSAVKTVWIQRHTKMFNLA